MRRATVAAGAAILSCLAVPAMAQTPAEKPPSGPAVQQADPQQIREELDRLRKEFEAIRDSYGARLTALEAKLGAAAPTAVPPVAPLPEAAPTVVAVATAQQPAPASRVPPRNSSHRGRS